MPGNEDTKGKQKNNRCHAPQSSATQQEQRSMQQSIPDILLRTREQTTPAADIVSRSFSDIDHMKDSYPLSLAG